jgi:hypothetical protein
MTTNDLSAGAAILRLEDAARAVYNALRAIGLEATPARDAIFAQIVGVIDIVAYERDGIPLPVVDSDDDSGGGGVPVR